MTELLEIQIEFLFRLARKYIDNTSKRLQGKCAIFSIIGLVFVL